MSAKIITAFSNKGGVGKTFVTVNTATALALLGYKVLLLDLDLQGGHDMARMLNLSPRKSVADVLPELEAMEDDAAIHRLTTKHTSGLEYITAVKTTAQIGHITPDNIKPFLGVVSNAYDFVLIDAGQNFSELLITVLDFSNLILLVATPDILAVYQIKWCLEVLQNLQFPLKMVKLVLNRSESRGSVAWKDVRTALSCEIFGHIPSDGNTVGLALNRGVPCVMDNPKSRVAEAFKKLASVLRNETMYVALKETQKNRSMEGLQKPNDFWGKFGITQSTISTAADVAAEEDEVIALKKRVHEKLVDRLNLEGVSTEMLSDPSNALKLKKTAESVVSNLLVEESGGKIASHQERMLLVNDIVNEALGLGALEDFLADPDVTDIMVNSKDEIYVEKNGKLLHTNKRFISDSKMRSIIDRIIAPLGRRIDESVPMVDARLPDGSRINAIIPPLSLNGPMITIRKFGKERLRVDDLMTRYHSISQAMSSFLNAAVVCRKNMIVSGGTGAGKTTLLNVLSEFIPDNERIITIEDAAELRLKKSHWARLEARPSNVEGKGSVTIRDLFINSLRMRPDRIVIGECRGAEVLDMLQAMNTGHDGSMTTLHANSTRDVLTRMHSMILLSGVELPLRAINEMIASAIDLVVHINRFSDGTRKLTGVTEVVGIDKDFQLILEDVFLFNQTGVDSEGKIVGEFQPTGYVPTCYQEFEVRGLGVDKSIFEINKS